MKLRTVFVRFYKSFNFDYMRKFRPGAREYPWEKIGAGWFPYVRVPIDAQVTTVVGANESGKTHLLSAIENGITGKNISSEDLCRHSEFFTVGKGQMRWPDFGFHWDLSETEEPALRELLGLEANVKLSEFLCFRRDRSQFDVYLPNDGSFAHFALNADDSKTLEALLPTIYKIDPKVALPDTVPIRYLLDEEGDAGSLLSRADRYTALDQVAPLKHEWVNSPDALKNAAGQVQPILNELVSLFSKQKKNATSKKLEPAKLARQLLLNIADIDQQAIADLHRALRDGKEGHVNSLLDQVNGRLASRLNFPKWWAQDKEFALVVSARDEDLVFTIQDRTGKNYSFGERSQGLKFFLSYYVQYKSHVPPSDRSEILLMDEPDAFLSSQAQQDLVRVFQAFATPNDGKTPIQVVYVTHSPFLIDKNHAERIRVLEKGSRDEGTRVVKDASKNHYEPLRSAFGAFVAETAFIGTCNLFVEGSADQVLLAGANAYLRNLEGSSLDVLDLNTLTVVPCGSAEQVPYLAFLARGRDVERPALIALLDTDVPGDKAKKSLLRDDLRHRQLLRPDFVLQVGDLLGGSDPASRWSTKSDVEIEDLIHPELCAAGARANLNEIGAPKTVIDEITKDAILGALKSGAQTWDAVKALVSTTSNGEFHIEKVGFARGVVSALGDPKIDQAAKDTFVANFSLLFRRLGEMQRKAIRERDSVSLAQRLERARSSFLRDNQLEAKKERALLLIEDLEHALDHSRESDQTKLELQALVRDFDLKSDPAKLIHDYESFKSRLERIKYTGRIISQTDAGDYQLGDEPAPS